MKKAFRRWFGFSLMMIFLFWCLCFDISRLPVDSDAVIIFCCCSLASLLPCFLNLDVYGLLKDCCEWKCISFHHERFISSCKCNSRLLLPTFSSLFTLAFFYIFDVQFVAVIMRNLKARSQENKRSSIGGDDGMNPWEEVHCARALSISHLAMHKFCLINL